MHSFLLFFDFPPTFSFEFHLFNHWTMDQKYLQLVCGRPKFRVLLDHLVSVFPLDGWVYKEIHFNRALLHRLTQLLTYLALYMQYLLVQ